jgi:hypothetical protein
MNTVKVGLAEEGAVGIGFACYERRGITVRLYVKRGIGEKAGMVNSFLFKKLWSDLVFGRISFCPEGEDPFDVLGGEGFDFGHDALSLLSGSVHR